MPICIIDSFTSTIIILNRTDLGRVVREDKQENDVCQDANERHQVVGVLRDGQQVDNDDGNDQDEQTGQHHPVLIRHTGNVRLQTGFVA